MFVPTRDVIFEMTPTEFEKFALRILAEQTKGLEKVNIVHNKMVEAYDGNYQLEHKKELLFLRRIFNLEQLSMLEYMELH